MPSVLKDPEIDHLFGPNVRPEIKRHIQVLLQNQTIKESRDNLVEGARRTLQEVDDWIASRDTTDRREGQDPGDGPSISGISSTLPLRTGRNRRPYSMDDPKPKNGARTDGLESKNQQASNPNLPVQEGSFKKALDEMTETKKLDAALEEFGGKQEFDKMIALWRQASKEVSDFESRKRAVSSSRSGSTSSKVRVVPPQLPQVAGPTRRRNLESSHQSNNSAPGEERHASSSAIGQASGQADASDRDSMPK